MTPDDAELLRRYVHEGAKEAFGELVQRHLGVVYHAALRQVGGDSHRAEEVAQEVFALLARKAPGLLEHTMLIGWLFSTTRRTAWRLARAERRRMQREHEAWAMHAGEAGLGEAKWETLRPVLDEVMNQLKPAERDALLLRYFQERPFAEIGQRFSVSEDAARMRVERALEKLRTRLVRRGVTSTMAALAVLLAKEASAAAPGGLAENVTSTALQKATVTGAATVLAKLFIMTKTQAIVCGSVLAVIAGGLFHEWQRNAEARDDIARARQQNAVLCTELEDQEREIEAARKSKFAPALKPLTDAQLARKQDLKMWNRKSLDRQYAALFRHLRLSPAEVAQLKDLIAEREWEQTVELNFARKSGLNDLRNTESRQIMAAAANEGTERLKTFLGADGWTYFEQYNRSVMYRNLFSRFTDELKLVGHPLSDDQMDQFAELAYVHMETGTLTWREGGGPEISEAMLTTASSFLNETQMVRLRAAQQELGARRKMAAMARAAAEEGKIKVTEHMSKCYPKCPVDRD